ncbi:PREDICTED: uncharacterized protein PF11_0213-like [Dufourea novaeangliae]|uniref:uncharacterized protein PF11_0213-like n=1 Tax=Dufourea novaeangliae TaxID=178035 RepID=UPI000767138C|nr:PREDICTED: uncharacterized protein PF11_0213-like [Dufourea novaeangliae]
MEDDIDIYEDLPSFNTKFDETSVPEISTQENITREYAELKKHVAELTIKLEDFRKVNENLETNLSSLLKTAKAEIARKDKMIDDLRRKVDDFTFRKGAYIKTNDHIIRKSTFRDINAGTRCKPAKTSLPLNQDNHALFETDVSYNLPKDCNITAPTLKPLTVFGERLRKRMVEEQNLERIDKQTSIFSNNNNVVSTEGYVTESDKENGSLRKINSPIPRELQSPTLKQYSEDEHYTATNFPCDNRNYTGKRRIDEIVNENGRVGAKRIKSDSEEYIPESKDVDTRKDTIDMSNEKRDFTNNNKFESFNKSCALRRTAHSDGEHVYNSSIKSEKRSRRPIDPIKNGERRSTKDENDAFYNKKQLNEYFSKRHYEPTGSSTCTLDDRNASHRSSEVSRKDDYRISSIEYHRIKQKEDRRVNETKDHRSRGNKSSYSKYREEKYARDKCNKYTDHGEKIEKRYDCVDKSKAMKKEWYDSRVSAKRSTTERNTDNAYISDRYDNYESRRFKPVDKLTKRGDKRLDESNVYSSHRNSITEKLTERTRHLETSKRGRSAETNNCLKKIDRLVDQREFTENENPSKVYRELRKRQKQDSKKIEEGDDTISSNNNINKKRGRSKDSRRSIDEAASSVSLDIANKNSEIDESVKTESVHELQPLYSDVLQQVTVVTSLGEQCHENIENIEDIENVENVENIPNVENVVNIQNVENIQIVENIANIENSENTENVENIEKFIRDYAPGSEDLDKDLEKKHIFAGTKVHTSVNDDFTYKITLEEPSSTNFTESNVEKSLPLEVHHADKKVDTVVELRDAFQQVPKDSVGNDCIENQTVTTAVENTNGFAVQSNCALHTDVSVLENNFLIDLAIAKTSVSLRTEGLLGSTQSDNTPQSDAIQSGEKESNGNDENFSVSTSKDSDGDKTNGRCNHNNYNKSNSDDIDGKTISNDCKIASEEEKVKENNVKGNLDQKTGDENEFGKGTVREQKLLNESIRSADKVNSTNGKATSVNVQGKIIMFARRRRKPVCLANSNADMTVLINNNRSVNNS